MKFSFVTFEQLDNLSKLHPLVLPFLTKSICKFYETCPDITNDFPVFFYLCDNSQIVPMIRAIPDTMTDMTGRTHRWAWTGGLETLPAYRGKGLASFRPETVLFRHGGVNPQACLYGVPMYASAQPLDFLAPTKNPSFPARKLASVRPEFPDGH